jgi:hypothetical protein
VALIRPDVSEDRIASIFRVHECEQVTERSCKLLYRHRLVSTGLPRPLQWMCAVLIFKVSVCN